MTRSKTDDRPQILPRRLHAIVATHPGDSLRALTLRLKQSSGKTWTARHVGFVADGERVPSKALLDALREALTPAEWGYLTGTTDRLPTSIARAA